MSQLLAPTHTYADNIPLGRRIAEIMQEKGSAYTIAAMSKRLGINRETLRLMLKGEREIYTFELEKIAKDLKLPVERILQADIVEEYQQMQELHWSHEDEKLALEIAQTLLGCAVGITERCSALNMLGNSYFGLRDLNNADEKYTQALSYAKVVLDKYGEPKLLLYITLNLLSIMATRKKYTSMKQLIADAEPYFESDPNLRAPATVYYHDANIKEAWEGDIEGARKSLHKSIYYYELLGNPFSIARAQYQLASFEYRQQNYEASYDFFQVTWAAFKELKDHYHHVVNGRDFAKLLIRMEKLSQAKEVIMNCLDTIQANSDMNWWHLEGDLNLLAALTEQNPVFAQKIVVKKLGSLSIQKLANKFVIEHYERIGDTASKITFEKQVGKLRPSPIDMLLSTLKLSTDMLLTLFDFIHWNGWHMVEDQ